MLIHHQEDPSKQQKHCDQHSIEHHWHEHHSHQKHQYNEKESNSQHFQEEPLVIYIYFIENNDNVFF